jgi:hypothetical protein
LHMIKLSFSEGYWARSVEKWGTMEGSRLPVTEELMRWWVCQIPMIGWE